MVAEAAAAVVAEAAAAVVAAAMMAATVATTAGEVEVLCRAAREALPWVRERLEECREGAVKRRRAVTARAVVVTVATAVAEVP